MIFFLKIEKNKQVDIFNTFQLVLVDIWWQRKKKRELVDGYIKYLQMEEIENIYFMQEKWIIISL